MTLHGYTAGRHVPWGPEPSCPRHPRKGPQGRGWGRFVVHYTAPRLAPNSILKFPGLVTAERPLGRPVDERAGEFPPPPQALDGLEGCCPVRFPSRRSTWGGNIPRSGDKARDPIRVLFSMTLTRRLP